MRKMPSEMPRVTSILSFRLSAAHGARGPAACHFERNREISKTSPTDSTPPLGMQQQSSLITAIALKECSFLRREEKEPKKHHPSKASPQGEDATAPPVALSLRYSQTIKALACVFIIVIRKYPLSFRLSAAHGEIS